MNAPVLPPNSLEAEQSLLGALLIENHAFDRIADLLSADDFYRDDHRRTFRHIAKLIERGKPADVLTVSASIEASEDKDKTGGQAYLGALAQNTPSALNVQRYAEIIRERAQLRAVLEVGHELRELATSPTGATAGEIVARAEERLLGVLDHGTQDYSTLQEVLAKVVRRVDEAQHRGGAMSGVPTGFADLDRMTGGLEPGDLIIVAARPSMGKTAFAMNVAEYVARKVGPVAFFSLEMAQAQVGMRVLAGRCRVPMADLRGGRLSDEQWHDLTNAVADLDLPILIDESAAVTCSHIRARARRMQRRYGRLALLVVDYLQLMSAPGENRTQEVSAISRGLKGIAKELNVPVLCLSQLSRAVEQRADRRPMMSDLRESGAIEQDADVILFIYRDEVYIPDTWQRGCAQLLIRKQRNGPIGDVWLTFIDRLMRFENCAERPRAPGSVTPVRPRRGFDFKAVAAGEN